MIQSYQRQRSELVRKLSQLSHEWKIPFDEYEQKRAAGRKIERAILRLDLLYLVGVPDGVSVAGPHPFGHRHYFLNDAKGTLLSLSRDFMATVDFGLLGIRKIRYFRLRPATELRPPKHGCKNEDEK